jgi:hypothetical protein
LRARKFCTSLRTARVRKFCISPEIGTTSRISWPSAAKKNGDAAASIERCQPGRVSGKRAERDEKGRYLEGHKDLGGQPGKWNLITNN